jgi:hypothetical protein
VFCGLFCFFVFFSFWWDNDRTTSEITSPGLETEGLTSKLLGLKLYYIWAWRFFLIILLNFFLLLFHCILFYFLFLFYLFILVFLLSSLCLSNACLTYCWLIRYLSLFISLTQFLFLLLVGCVFLTCSFICFSLFLYFFAFPLLSSFHYKYHHCYYYKLENT